MTGERRDQTTRTWTRRALLTSLGAGVVTLSGCRALQSDDAVTDRPGSPTRTASPTPSPTPTPTGRDQYVYASQPELEAVADRVREDQNPWKRGYQRVLQEAERAMEMSPRSVVDDGAPAWNDPHQFGEVKGRHDYHAAIEMTAAIRDCALAHRFTDEDRYAERAIDLLHHWCFAPETRMKPNAEIANAGPEIELWITIPKLWYAAALLHGHPYWQEKTDRDLEAAFREWVRSFADSIHDPGYHQSNNMWSWLIATLAGAGSYLGDQSMLDRAFCMWRAECETAAHGKDSPRPWSQYEPRGENGGSLRRELKRKDGLDYHIYGIKALTMTAEIARHHGVDLYGFNAPTDPHDGSSLKKLFDFMIPYLESPAEWKWGTGSDGVEQNELRNYAALFELAYSHWGDQAYLDTIRTVGRPTYDYRILGWTSLTHANLFDLDGS